MRNRIHIKVSSLAPVDFKEYKKQNDSTALNAIVKAKPKPETLTQIHGSTNPPTTPMRPLGWSRTTVQCTLQTQCPTTTVCVQNHAVQRNNIIHYGCMVRPPNRLIEEIKDSTKAVYTGLGM